MAVMGTDFVNLDHLRDQVAKLAKAIAKASRALAAPHAELRERVSARRS